MTLYEDKWISIELFSNKQKTKVYSVWSKCSEDNIGYIKWYPAWRHYCFFPEGEIVLSDRCLLNIGQVVKELNEEHGKREVSKED